MFGLNMRACAVNNLNNYADALAFYDSCPTRRGTEYGDSRPIRGKAGSRDINVYVQSHSRRVCFRYHSTDVVVWSDNNECQIDLRWDSRSTAEFANRFIPYRVDVINMCKGILLGNWTDGRVYPGRGVHTLLPDGTLKPDGRQFVQTRIDRAKAKALMTKVGYYEYLAWWKIMRPMVDRGGAKVEFLSGHEIVEMLKDPENYHRIMTSTLGHPDALRDAVYNFSSHLLGEDPVHFEHFEPHLPASTNLAKWRVR